MVKVRLSILVGEIVLGVVSIVALWLGYPEAATAAIGGICGTLPKLVESEEKSG